MTMTPTATGYDLTVKPPPRHRAYLTAEQAALCLETRAFLKHQPEHGVHYVATFTPAALLAEYNARIHAAVDVTR